MNRRVFINDQELKLKIKEKHTGWVPGENYDNNERVRKKKKD